MVLVAKGELAVVMTKETAPDPMMVWDDGFATAPAGSPDGVMVTVPPKPCAPLIDTFKLTAPFGTLLTIDG